MKSTRIIAAAAGVLVFISIVFTFVWFSSPSRSNSPKELSLAEIEAKIEKGEVREAAFKKSQVEITDVKGEKFYANLGSDPTREALLASIKEFNKTNTRTPIKYSEEPTQTGWGWIVLLNSLPFYLMWAATLVVIIYAVRTLSRNKG